MIDKEALWRDWQAAPTPAHRNAIAEAYLYLAQAVARRFTGRGAETEDLVQVASLALLHAIERFDAGKGLQFTTFAVPTIAGEVRNHLRDKARLVRLPRRGSELLSRIERAREEQFRLTGREPSVPELAQLLHETPDSVLSALEMRAGAVTLSLDAETADDGPTLAEQLGAEEEAFGRVESEDALQSLFKRLPPPLGTVLRERYVQGRSQREIAARLGVSQMQISRLEKKAITLLRAKKEEML